MILSFFVRSTVVSPFGMASGERCGEMFGLRRKPAFVNYHFSANRSFPFAIFALFMFIFRLHGKT